MNRAVRGTGTRNAARVLLAGPFLLILFVPPAFAGDAPFTYPSNFGLTGLMETPTARVLEVNRYRLGATEIGRAHV